MGRAGSVTVLAHCVLQKSTWKGTKLVTHLATLESKFKEKRELGAYGDTILGAFCVVPCRRFCPINIRLGVVVLPE